MRSYKEQCRTHYLAQLKMIAKAQKKIWEASILDQVKELIQQKNCQKVAIYLSREHEVDTWKLLDWLLATKIEVFVPYIINARNIGFYAVKNKTELQKQAGCYTIISPETAKKATEFDLMIVPLIAFDENCFRLGSGKGFYDRYFNQHTGIKKTLLVGIAFKLQFHKISLKIDFWDYPLDKILINF